MLQAGTDEVGRGCLAGPVVAAAVILPDEYDLPYLTDSKALSARRRQKLAPAIRSCALAWGLGVVWPARIMQINILQASLEAMAIAISWLRKSPACILIDGSFTIPAHVLDRFWRKRHAAPLPKQIAIIKGDAKIPAISAASILAKTFRDRLMTAFSRIWPEYGFDQHKGYGTRQHFMALQKSGPCRIHRLNFKGVSQHSLLDWQ